MIVTPQTAADFLKYYGSSYIIVPEAEPNQFGYVAQVDANGCILKYNNGQKAQIIYSQKGYEVTNPLILQKQYFTDDNGEVCFIERIPARRWKKGIASTNTRISSPDDQPYEICFNILNAFLNNKDKVTPAEKIKETGQGVLSPNWCIYKNVVYIKGFKVGVLNPRKGALILMKDFVPMFPKSFSHEWRILNA